MFSQIRVSDTTDSAAQIAQRWHRAREKRKEELIAAEGQVNFEGLQRFLSCVHVLTSEKRLHPYLYLAITMSCGEPICTLSPSQTGLEHRCERLPLESRLDRHLDTLKSG